MPKERVTITVEVDMLNHAKSEVQEGHCRSVSEWISRAMAEQMAKDDRMAARRELAAILEADHGPFSHEEIAEQVRKDREAAEIIRQEGEREYAEIRRQMAQQVE